MVHSRVFLDFAIDGSSIGRVVFELFSVSAPKTSENFRELCTGERGISPKSQMPLYYKHSKIHRVIQDFMIQGGDFTKGNGTGGESIYGAPFADEDLSRPVDQQGLLCMANKGPNTNNSQFFITLRPCPHLTGKHVVFGRVIRGFDDVVQKIANVKTDEKDRPVVPVEIVNCGELQLVKKPAVVVKDSERGREREERDESGSESESEEERGRKRKRLLQSASHSPSPSRSLSRSRSRSPSRSRFRTPSRARSRSRSPSNHSSSEAERSHHKSKNKKVRSHKDKKDKKDKKERKEKKEKKHRKHKKHKHRSPTRSRSRSRSGSLSRSRSRSRSQAVEAKISKTPHQETEEEYDARLEREERERLEAFRRYELAEMKRRYEKGQAQSGVRFKGRGKMKFMDPELHSRRNY